MKGRSCFGLSCGLALAVLALPARANDLYAGAEARPRMPLREMKLAAEPVVYEAAQSGSGGHSVVLTFTASASAASCLSPCSFGYNVFRGTAAGGESATPLNSVPISGTTYTDSTVMLGSAPVTYYYTVEAVETVGGVTVASGPSNEASASFPGIPSAPTTLGAAPH